MSKIFSGILVSLVVLTVVASCKKKDSDAKKSQRAMVGRLAPDFSLLDETGVIRKLSDYRGQKVVLYFYPKDFTTGCTKQACSLRDNFEIYRENNIAILGVSYDSVEKHKKFKETHHLPYPLLSDSNHAVAKKYGANRGVLGYFMPSRMTFLINEQGVIVQILTKIDIAKQADQILSGFKK